MAEIKLREAFLKSKSIQIKREGDRIIIENNRKSRFIMKDAKSLVDKIENSGVQMDKGLVFRSRSPVCGKSKRFLSEKGVDVES